MSELKDIGFALLLALLDCIDELRDRARRRAVVISSNTTWEDIQ